MHNVKLDTYRQRPHFVEHRVSQTNHNTTQSAAANSHSYAKLSLEVYATWIDEMPGSYACFILSFLPPSFPGDQPGP